MKRGAELGRSYPRTPISPYGNLLQYSQGGVFDPIELGAASQGDLENGEIVAVTPLDAFRPGQQILFSLTIYNGFIKGDQPKALAGAKGGGIGPAGPAPSFDSWVSSVRLKPWFLRQGDEFRGPGGAGGWTQNDNLEFGGGTVQNNRAVWYPVVKMIDISEWQSVNPPTAAPPRHSTSIFEDDVWQMDLQDPNNPDYQKTRLPGQIGLARTATFMYVCHGYALGFTYQCAIGGNMSYMNPDWGIDLNWQLGTL